MRAPKTADEAKEASHRSLAPVEDSMKEWSSMEEPQEAITKRPNEERLAERLLDLWVKEKKGKSTEDDRAEAEAINTRLQKMRLDKEYARVVKIHIYWKLGLRSLVPTRKTTLDGEQQGLRARLTWQSFDLLQWKMAGFGGAQDV